MAVSSISTISAQRKTHRQIASGGGFGELGYEFVTSSVPVLQKTRNSCRHCCACRCNSLALLDDGTHRLQSIGRLVKGEIQNLDGIDRNISGGSCVKRRHSVAPALSAGGQTSLAPMTSGGRDPSLRLKSGCAQDDAASVR